MSYTIIPAPPNANETFDCVLDGQLATITLTTTDYGLYADIIYNGVPVANGQICLDRTDINPNRYFGMPQALFFADLQGTSDPVYTGFNSRYLLLYGDPPVASESNGSFVFGSTGELDSTFILNESFLG